MFQKAFNRRRFLFSFLSVNGREAQGFPWSLRKLRPVDVLGVVRQVASRINGDVSHRNDVSDKEAASYEEEDDGDVDGSENDEEDWLGDDEEYGDILYNVDGVDGDVSDGEVIDDEL